MKNKQWKWSCDKCKKSDIVTIEPNVGVTEGILKVKDAHAKQSPKCKWDAWAVQVKQVR